MSARCLGRRRQTRARRRDARRTREKRSMLVKPRRPEGFWKLSFSVRLRILTKEKSIPYVHMLHLRQGTRKPNTKAKLRRPGSEPGTHHVLGARYNRYTAGTGVYTVDPCHSQPHDCEFQSKSENLPARDRTRSFNAEFPLDTVTVMFASHVVAGGSPLQREHAGQDVCTRLRDACTAKETKMRTRAVRGFETRALTREATNPSHYLIEATDNVSDHMERRFTPLLGRGQHAIAQASPCYLHAFRENAPALREPKTQYNPVQDAGPPIKVVPIRVRAAYALEASSVCFFSPLPDGGAGKPQQTPPPVNRDPSI